MQGHNHSYLDLSVLPKLGRYVLSLHAAVVFKQDLTAILWANAAGARLFGGSGIADILSARLSDAQSFVRQLRGAISQMEGDNPLARGFRIHQGIRSRLLPCEISHIELPAGGFGILLTCDEPEPGALAGENLLAKSAVAALDGFADASAILDDFGLPLAASKNFGDVGLSEDMLNDLVEELSREDDRLIKRPVENVLGQTFAAGLGRLTDTPGRNLIVLADTADIEGENDRDDSGVPSILDEINEPEAEQKETGFTGRARSLLDRWYSRDEKAADEVIEAQTLDAEPAVDNSDPVSKEPEGDFLFEHDEGAVRFAWVTDENATFRSISPELAKTVGPNAADIVGRRWSDVATVFGFDNNGSIRGLLERRDTWSGKTVLWPVQGTDLAVPVDLAALPAFGTGRIFEGFRGFGIIRTSDAVLDLDATGLALTAPEIDKLQDPSSEDSDIVMQLGAGEDEQASDAPTNIVKLVPRGNEPVDEAGQAAPKAALPTDTSLLEKLPVAVLVYRSGETLFANHELLKATGYESTEELAEAGGVEVILNQIPPQDAIDADPHDLIRKDGECLDIQPFLHTVPWGGEKALLLSFVTPRENTAPEPPALAIAEVSEVQNILDTASDGIIVMETDGTIISINASAEALFGCSYDDISGKNIRELFAIESRKVVDDYVQDLSSPGVSAILNDGREVIGQEAKGGLIPMFVTLSRMDSSGNLCAVIRDMTSWKNAEEELVKSRRQAEEASEQKSGFLAHVSHEIRTPLNAIIGFSDVMIEERFGPVENDRYREYLRDINRSGIHVLDLINDLLDLSKIEAGKMELAFEAVDLNLIVSESVALLQPEANQNRIIIRTSLSRAVPKVVADPRSVRQIILNLVSNAIKFSPLNGQVIVSTVYENNGEVALRIRDTGSGMSAQEIKEAMKPFQQIRGSGDKNNQGTGLGLPLTKALVEANKAHFDLESKPQGGTIAHVQFPTQRVLAD